MAIGPSAAHMASGGVVVVATFYAMLGLTALVLGLGPILIEADPVPRVIGAGSVLAGVFLGMAAAALLLRWRSSRWMGVAAGGVSIALGAMLAGAMILTIGDGCRPAGSSGPDRCGLMDAAIAVAAAAVSVAGVASIRIIGRTRRTYFKGRRRPARR